ncbi:uncharacterized protein LOC119597468 [Penaeus monodon]|uniref:uncharacterized protein LOC119597468 n=1 Tax=Penaeus monodon TaxID=6687 RepID=UPI0018A7670E|nr:uncharacterized protein LOC119597468 [Penaeus monodon]
MVLGRLRIAAKEIDHILVHTHWILQNCRVLRSAEFFATDHRLVVATLRLRLRSRRIPRSHQQVFPLERVKSEEVTQEYAVAVSNRCPYGIRAAYVDLKKAFDSVHRESLWSLLGLRGIPPGIIGLLSGLYTDTESAVKYLDFADDVVILAETLEVLQIVLEALHEEAKPLGLSVNWTKTKVQEFRYLLDVDIQSVHACGANMEILDSFTYLGSVV